MLITSQNTLPSPWEILTPSVIFSTRPTPIKDKISPPSPLRQSLSSRFIIDALVPTPSYLMLLKQ